MVVDEVWLPQLGIPLPMPSGTHSASGSDFMLFLGTEKKGGRLMHGGRKNSEGAKGGSPLDDLYADDVVVKLEDDVVSSSSDVGMASRSDLKIGPGIQSFGIAKMEEDQEEEKVKTQTGVALSVSLGRLHPQHWSPSEVTRFLRINDCGPYCQEFSERVRNRSASNT